MERKYTVYQHVFPNGYVYTGMTSRKPEKRFGKDGENYRNNECLYKAIKKYGWDAIQHNIVKDQLAKHEACELEKLLIAESGSKKYNRDDGGKGYSTYFWPELTLWIKAMSDRPAFHDIAQVLRSFSDNMVVAGMLNTCYIIASSYLKEIGFSETDKSTEHIIAFGTIFFDALFNPEKYEHSISVDEIYDELARRQEI